MKRTYNFTEFFISSLAINYSSDSWYQTEAFHGTKLIWASAWDFQQFGMCDQQSLRSACAYAQSDQSLC